MRLAVELARRPEVSRSMLSQLELQKIAEREVSLMTQEPGK